MSEHISKWGRSRTLARLVQHAGMLDEMLDRSLAKHYDTALFVTSTRSQPLSGALGKQALTTQLST